MGTLDDLAGAPFAAGSRLRRARVFHPDGVVVRGVLEPDGGSAGLIGIGERSTEVLARFSRGLGLPDRWPDVLGLAVKVPDVEGTGQDQDLLMVSSRRSIGAGRLIVPARSFDERPYSSLLPVDSGGRRLLIGAMVDAGGRPLRRLEDLRAAATAGRLAITILVDDRHPRHWRRVGTAVLDHPVPDEAAEQLAFDPWHCAAGLRPVGLLNRWRLAAYERSRRGRAHRPGPGDSRQGHLGRGLRRSPGR